MNKKELQKVMGTNVRKIRKSRNISIDELSELLSITSGFLGLIERGERGLTAYNIMQICVIFDISTDALFQYTDLDNKTKNTETDIALNKAMMLIKNINDNKKLDIINELICGLIKL